MQTNSPEIKNQLKKIAEEKNLRGKRVLLRLDLNVPVMDGDIRDDFKIKKSLPTLEFLKNAGAKTIIVSHLESNTTDSLSRVASHVSKSIPLKAFVARLDEARAVVEVMKDGEIIMLENLRKDRGEKENNPVFAGRLASLADIYVNDAFAVCHREHASIVSLPRLLPSFAGPLLAREIESLSRAFNPPRPFLCIIGGAKFETKLPLIERFLELADHVFVGGALAHDLFREKGYEIGQSVISKTAMDLKHVELSPRIILPTDVTVAGPLAVTVKSPDSVGPDEKIVDAGPRTVSQISDLLNDVSFVLWNGPLGDYERGFGEGTEGLARAIAESKVESIIGGGDTIAIVSKLGLLDKFSFVSTGGGAMIEFLSRGTLQGIDALTR